MVNLGIVRGQEIRQNLRLLRVELTNASDVQTVQYLPMAGDDSPPQDGDQVVVLGIGTAFKVAIGVQTPLAPSADAGAHKIYSRDAGGAEAATVNLTTGGDVELNGSVNSAVLFAALNTQLQALVTAINAVLATKADAGGAAGTLTLDLSTAEATTVKLP